MPLRIYTVNPAIWPIRDSMLFVNSETGEPLVKLNKPGSEAYTLYPSPGAGDWGRRHRMEWPNWLHQSCIVGVMLSNYPTFLEALPRDLLEFEYNLAVDYVQENQVAMSLETMQRLAAQRIKLQREGRLSDEELIETVRMLRQDRVAAASASENKRAAAAPVDTASILDKLKNFSTKP